MSFVETFGILSFLASIIALCVACMAYRLQKKSDKDLTRIEDNIKQLDKIVFEMEKNRLIDIVKKLNVSEENKRKLLDGIRTIFHEEREEKFNLIENDAKLINIEFIKTSKKQYALPKMFYPFDRILDFPYFCVFIKNIGNEAIIEEGYYFLSYEVFVGNEDNCNWYIAKKYPIAGGYKQKIKKESHKVDLSIDSYRRGSGPGADQFCEHC